MDEWVEFACQGVADSNGMLLGVEIEESKVELSNCVGGPCAAEKRLDTMVDHGHLVGEEQGVKLGAVAIAGPVLFDVQMPSGKLIVQVAFTKNEKNN